MLITECDALCSSVATSTCVDVALLSQSAHEGVETTTTKTIHLDCIPIPYVGFQQLFFKNNVFKPNEILTNQNTYFKQYIENNKRIITSIDHDKCSPHALNTNLNLYKQMSDLYECEAEQLITCWDTRSKIKFTKSVSKVKNLTDLTSVCPVECALSLDDMFCALEANADDPLTIDPDTNMPEPPPSWEELDCPPQLSRTDPDPVILCKDQFVYIPDTDVYDCDMTGPTAVTLTLRDCSGQISDCSNVLVVDASQGALVDCYGVTVETGTILISGIYVDGLYGAGGQYILTTSDTGVTWDVKYWEQSAIVNITTRLNGKVPLLDGCALQAAELEKDICNNTNYTPIQIANKEVVLDIIWKFKVDLTPASSGTGGYGYHKSDGKPYGWSYPKYNMTDDRQRKSLSRPEAIKLMTSVKHISILAKDYRDNLLSCGGASATQSAQSSTQSSAQSSAPPNDVYALAYALTLGDTAFTANTIDPNGNPPTLIAYKYAGHTINNSSISKVSVQVQRNIKVSYQGADITILLIKKSVTTYTILGRKEISGTSQEADYQPCWTDHLTETDIKVKTIDFHATESGWFANENDEIYIGISYPDPDALGNYPEGNEDAKLLDNFFTNTLDASGQVLQNTTVISSLSAATDDNIVLLEEYPETTTDGPLFLMYYKISIT
jgi:hypothetical protein